MVWAKTRRFAMKMGEKQVETMMIWKMQKNKD
jgi:hypothetical protein